MTGIKFSFYEPAPANEVDESFEVEASMEVNQSIEVDNIERMLTSYSEEEEESEEAVVDVDAAKADATSSSGKPVVVEEMPCEEQAAGAKESVRMDGDEEEDFVDATEEGPEDEGYIGTVDKPEAGPTVDKSATKLTQRKSEDTCATQALSPNPTESFASTNPANEDFLTVSTSAPKTQALSPIHSVRELSPVLSVQVLSPVPTPSFASTDNSAVSASVSHKLKAMMQERVQAIDKIRSLLETEKEHDSSVVSKFTGKIAVLEQTITSKKNKIGSLNNDITQLKAKNADYALQLTNLSSTINELVEGNNEHVQGIALLEKDVAAKENTIKEMGEDIQGKQLALDKNAIEIASLAEQLEEFKAENKSLEVTVKELELKNSDLAIELENILASLKELVEQNATLETQVEELIKSNNEQAKMNESIKGKNVELLDAVEALTESLNEARSCHEKDVNTLQKQNAAMKEAMKKEKEVSDATIRQLEKLLEDTASEMTAQMTSIQESLERKVKDRTKSLEEAKEARKKAIVKNEKLQSTIEDVKCSAAKSAGSTATTISQLEKDLEEEFQVATQLKRGMEDLKKKMTKEGNDEDVSAVEDMLGNLRMIQCWQLSHFQRINKLVTENKDQSRNVQML